MTLTAVWRSSSITTLVVGTVLLLSSCATSQSTPPPKPQLPSLSAEQAQSLESQAIDAAWTNVTNEFPDATRPSVDTVRRVTPAEQPEAIASCLQDAGYTDANADDDGGIAYGTIPDGQESAQAITLYTCYAKYPIDAKYTQPATESQIEYIYYYWQHDLTPCLEAEGLEVSDPPSWNSFQETFGTRAMWDPYEALANEQDASAVAAITKKCVRYPSEYNGY